MRVIFLQTWGKNKKGDNDFVERSLGRRLVRQEIAIPYKVELVPQKKVIKKPVEQPIVPDATKIKKSKKETIEKAVSK